MHILIFAQHFAPESVSGAVLATELALDLTRKGHHVDFITCAPNYPDGKVFSGYKNSLFSKENVEGVKVVRTWSYISQKRGFWQRAATYLSFSVSALLGGLVSSKPGIILSYSPPLPLGLSAWLMSRFRRVPWVLRVEDLFPDAAIAAGYLKNEFVQRLFFRMEGFLYQKADHISLISEGFRKYLINKGIAESKLSVIPVWADPDFIQPLPKENRFRNQHGFKGKFIILYAGNLGHNSAIEDVIFAGKKLQGNSEIKIVIVGEGVKKGKLVCLANELNLSNITFLPYQPRENLAQLMSAADISLVTLNEDSFFTSLPSKTFSIMASSRPILSITPSNSEIAKLVNETGCGVNVPPNQPDLLAKTILKLNQDQDRLLQMGAKGRECLEAYYTRERCVGMFEETLKKVLN